ncbi:MAG: DNA-processing protein DprA [Candidatus Saccharibacteria bacterium]|nr:DNA-processing protein DprA [Candidatus Saccharibacteria bacterium]
MKIKKLTLKSTEFPECLKNIPSPPKQIFVRGNPSVLLQNNPVLTVVGTRKVSPYGREVTDKFVREVASKGVTIVSGLALGVDILAHRAALSVGGSTIAVLPCSLDSIYPSSHYHDAMKIVEQGGALISEYPEGTEPFKTNFIERNRLVSGLGDGVLITEAAEKSGTLHTANFALEQGKTVMAIPGNITSPLSKGTNNLIKSGALPITDSSDILFALGVKENKANEQVELFGGDQGETNILNLIASGITDASELQRQSDLNPGEFNQTITMLEINGRIRSLGAGHWTLS